MEAKFKVLKGVEAKFKVFKGVEAKLEVFKGMEAKFEVLKGVEWWIVLYIRSDRVSFGSGVLPLMDRILTEFLRCGSAGEGGRR